LRRSAWTCCGPENDVYDLSQTDRCHHHCARLRRRRRAVRAKGASNLFTDPSGRYSIEFPKNWSWTIVEGAGEALSTFVHPKKEAAIVVERFPDETVLSQGDITDIFAQIESDLLKENQPRVSDVSARVMTQGTRAWSRSTTNGRASASRARSRTSACASSRSPSAAAFTASPASRCRASSASNESICQWAAESLKSAEELASK
jgi:hypothetical protein